MWAKVHDRINVGGNPINAIDPFGLEELVHQATLLGHQNARLFLITAKTQVDWKAGTAKSGINPTLAQLEWKGDTKRLSGTAGVYHWNTELSGGMTNIYSLGALEATAKIAAFEGKVSGLIKIADIYIKLSGGGTLGSLGAEGKIGLRGVKAGLHALVGLALGVEWGFVDELSCK